MARRRTLGKKRKSYRKTRNKKIKKTVRKTRRMRGGGLNSRQRTGAVLKFAANAVAEGIKADNDEIKAKKRTERTERWMRPPE